MEKSEIPEYLHEPTIYYKRHLIADCKLFLQFGVLIKTLKQSRCYRLVTVGAQIHPSGLTLRMEHIYSWIFNDTCTIVSGSLKHCSVSDTQMIRIQIFFFSQKTNSKEPN